MSCGLALEIQRQTHAGIGFALLRFQVLLEILVLRFQQLIALLRADLRETGDVALLVEIERRRDLGKARVALRVCEALGISQVGTEDLLEIVGGHFRRIQTFGNSRISTIFLFASRSETLSMSPMAFW